MKLIIQLLIKILLILLILFVLFMVSIRLYILINTRMKISSIENVPKSKIAIVFGAGLRWDGSPSPVLRDRVETAVELYKNGRVEKILMSGANENNNYNEPMAMFKYAQELGVPQEDIIIDLGGRSTYDTCYRAHTIFHFDQAILVTQTFHLSRAIYLCEHLGISANGVSSDRRQYFITSQLGWQLREIPASLEAMWDIWIIKPKSSIY